MKKVIFYIPAIIFSIFYGAVAFIGVGSISPIIFVWIGIFCISGYILNKKQVCGVLAGLLPAIHLIYMGTQETGQLVSEVPAGIVVLIFYVICGYQIEAERHRGRSLRRY